MRVQSSANHKRSTTPQSTTRPDLLVSLKVATFIPNAPIDTRSVTDRVAALLRTEQLKAPTLANPTELMRAGSPTWLVLQTSVKNFPQKYMDSVTPLQPVQLASTIAERTSANRYRQSYFHGLLGSGVTRSQLVRPKLTTSEHPKRLLRLRKGRV